MATYSDMDFSGRGSVKYGFTETQQKPEKNYT